jgi:hypothetical protein
MEVLVAAETSDNIAMDQVWIPPAGGLPEYDHGSSEVVPRLRVRTTPTLPARTLAEYVLHRSKPDSAVAGYRQPRRPADEYGGVLAEMYLVEVKAPAFSVRNWIFAPNKWLV